MDQRSLPPSRISPSTPSRSASPPWGRMVLASRLRRLAAALLSLAIPLGMPESARATILTFDQFRNGDLIEDTGSGSLPSDDYGDNVTGAAMAVPGGVYTYGEAGEGFTPDVTVDIRSSLDSATDPGVRLWQQGYGDLRNVVFGEGPGTAGAPLLLIRLTAAPGFVVDLYEVDLAHFSASSTTIAGVSVLDGDTTLFSAANVLVAGSSATPGRTNVSFATPLSAAELLLRIDVSNLPPGSQDNIGFDNLRFGQTPPRIVPEPGTAVLLLLGLTALATRPRSPRVSARSGPAMRPARTPGCDRRIAT